VVPISFLGPFLPDTTNAFTTNLNTGSVKVIAHTREREREREKVGMTYVAQVRWNASYAISNLLRNQHFASGSLDPDQLTCVRSPSSVA
jgi:hypothetical protein